VVSDNRGHDLHIAVGSHSTLVASIAIQAVLVASQPTQLVALVMVGLQWLVLFQATAGLLQRWVIPSIYSVLLYYLSTILAFGGTYFVCSKFDSSAFAFDRPLLRDETGGDPSTFYFFSISVQSLVGFGAVTAATYSTRTLVVVQQVAGLAYHAGIISQALERLKHAATKRNNQKALRKTAAVAKAVLAFRRPIRARRARLTQTDDSAVMEGSMRHSQEATRFPASSDQNPEHALIAGLVEAIVRPPAKDSGRPSQPQPSPPALPGSTAAEAAPSTLRAHSPLSTASTGSLQVGQDEDDGPSLPPPILQPPARPSLSTAESVVPSRPGQARRAAAELQSGAAAGRTSRQAWPITCALCCCAGDGRPVTGAACGGLQRCTWRRWSATLLLPCVATLEAAHIWLLYVLGGSDLFALQEQDATLLVVSLVVQVVVAAIVIISAYRAAMASVATMGEHLIRANAHRVAVTAPQPAHQAPFEASFRTSAAAQAPGATRWAHRAAPPAGRLRSEAPPAATSLSPTAGETSQASAAGHTGSVRMTQYAAAGSPESPVSSMLLLPPSLTLPASSATGTGTDPMASPTASEGAGTLRRQASLAELNAHGEDHTTAGLYSTCILIQSYLSAILLFGGVYVSIFLASPQDQPFSLRCGDVCLGTPDTSGRGPALSSVSFLEVVMEMVYLASTSLTSNGDGSVYPTRLWSRVAVGVNVLCGVLFNVVILAMGSSALQDMTQIQDVLDDAKAHSRKVRHKRRHHHHRHWSHRQVPPGSTAVGAARRVHRALDRLA
jgi:hypothetical protein